MNAATKTIAIFAATTFATSAAHADVFNMQFTGTGAGSTVQIHHAESNTFNAFAGELNHEITNATGDDAFLNGTWATFCADITEHVSSDGTEYQTAMLESIPLTVNNPNPMSSVQADAITTLYNNNAPSIINGGLSNAMGAAFQITIWEIIADFDGSASSINLNEGALAITGRNGDDLNSNIVNEFNSLKSQIMLGLNNEQSNQRTVIGLASAGAQDQLVAVPAPGAISLFAAGSLLVTRRRRA